MTQKISIIYHLTRVVLRINRHQTINAIRGLRPYLRDLKELKEQETFTKRLFAFGKPFPCLDERFSESGEATGHYFHQDFLIARKIFLNNPKTCVDVGSRVDGFVAHVASFREIEVIDIRPQSSKIPNIKFIQANLMEDIDQTLVNYCDSLSCLHALEHFGLGRYGDPVNYDGYLIGLNNLIAILKQGGKFYFSVPIGPQRIEFNAHRVFSVSYLIELLQEKFHIDCFSFVDDRGDLHEDVTINQEEVSRNFGCSYGCGIFEMTKL